MTHEVRVDVCAFAVTVLVVVVVVVVMVRAVVVLCVFCGCHVSIVMCPLLCVRCECLAVDHPLNLSEGKDVRFFHFREYDINPGLLDMS